MNEYDDRVYKFENRLEYWGKEMGSWFYFELGFLSGDRDIRMICLERKCSEIGCI